MNDRKLKILKPILRKNRCYFCGDTKSVRYILCVKDNGEDREIICCNICALIHYDITQKNEGRIE